MTAPAWTVAAAYAVPVLVLAGCAACGRRRRRHVPGLPDDGKGCMTEEEFLDFLLIVLKEDRADPEPERSA